MSADRDARIVTMDDRDDDRLELLDRIADRVPEIDLDQHETEWTTLPDGHEVLLVDGWSGGYFANYGDDLHAYGSLAPILDGFIGCIVIRRTAADSSPTRCPTRWRRSRTGTRG
jgi:hypothetical protein